MSWAGPQNRYCITYDDDVTHPDACCGGTCMALTSAAEWLGTQSGIRDYQHAEDILLNLEPGHYFELPGKPTIRLWRKF